jgi:hypothetical protein
MKMKAELEKKIFDKSEIMKGTMEPCSPLAR